MRPKTQAVEPTNLSGSVHPFFRLCFYMNLVPYNQRFIFVFWDIEIRFASLYRYANSCSEGLGKQMKK